MESLAEPPGGLPVDLHALTAVELGRAYARGRCSPREVTEAVLARIERCEPLLHATYALDADAARDQARAAEARWRAGAALGPLDGVPVTIKENIATRGVPLPLGTAATAPTPAAEDAPPAARLREAGAVIVCKTTMPDWGMLSSGLSSFHPLTRNPWNLEMNPGGSSAGAAAAAAAAYGPLHLGTDIGGSLRLPAGWCGVTTLKPSLGRVPIKPPYYGRVAGPIARTVADLALAMQVLAQPDPRDTMSLPPQAIAWASVWQHERDSAGDLRGLKVGLQTDAGWGLPVTPDTLAAVQGAARLFASAGADIEPLAPFTTREMIDGLDRFWRMRSWLDYAALPPERQARVLPYIRRWIECGERLGGAEVFHGFSQIGAIREATVAATLPFDVVLSPVSPVATFPAAWASPIDDPERPFEHIAFTLPYNMSEQPAAALPCGFTADGLPIGLQISGRRFDDLGVLRVARAFEILRGDLRPWPQPPFSPSFAA